MVKETIWFVKISMIDEKFIAYGSNYSFMDSEILNFFFYFSNFLTLYFVHKNKKGEIKISPLYYEIVKLKIILSITNPLKYH